MPPLKQTRAQMLQRLAALAIVALAVPLDGILRAGRRAFEKPPRLRKPQHSVKRDG